MWSKKTWFVIIILLLTIGWFAASKSFSSVDPWVATNVTGPLWRGLLSVKTTIATSAVWQSYGYYITAITCFVGGIVVYRWLRVKKLRWGVPKIPTKLPYQHEPSTSRPVEVRQETKQTTTPKEEPAPVAEKAEEGKTA